MCLQCDLLGELVFILEKLKPADCVCTKKPKPLVRDVGDFKQACRVTLTVCMRVIQGQSSHTLICKLAQLPRLFTYITIYASFCVTFNSDPSHSFMRNPRKGIPSYPPFLRGHASYLYQEDSSELKLVSCLKLLAYKRYKHLS